MDATEHFYKTNQQIEYTRIRSVFNGNTEYFIA